ncbi:hypothetical protein BF93_01520 [Brachybacterium phenoliresistens]|uniref:TIGR03089 family protein n=1 Tax=Brachybacterium phenoliresistens TaxID=396014 RepID=Z9JSP7_9MICO|nr:TIGR03089 family protein [Brachybacterium phenoliresistens]EWS80787.1 hypothetical protein BF93_01520 [Brachybacterium phenoliresistens]
MTPELRGPGPSRETGPDRSVPERGARVDRPAARLLGALEALGPRPALAWHGEPGRVELSGHVLANWIVKSVNHLDQELLLSPGDLVVIDLAPHWKRLVLAVAAWSLGARVVPADALGPGEAARVAVTDRPEAGPAADAEEVLAVDAVSLAMRFSGTLPPLAHDWVQEVRAHADVLVAVLPAWSGPEIHEDLAGGAEPAGQRELPRPLLLEQDGFDEPAAAVAALISGRGVAGPAPALGGLPGADGVLPARPHRART